MGVAERQWDLPEDFLPAGVDPPTITGQIRTTVMYQFFRKSMANDKPMHSRSAAPEREKMQTVTQEYIRRMKNTSRSLPWSHLEEAVSAYSKDLRRGGFSREWIRNALEAATVGYTRMVENEVKGISLINRPEHKGRKSRMVKKLRGKATWFKKIGNKNAPKIPNGLRKPYKTRIPQQGIEANRNQTPPESVLFIPFTPNGGLKKALQEAESQLNRFSFGRVKMVETLDRKLNVLLSNTSPWRNDHCGRDHCPSCESKPGQCLRRNIVYKISCMNCPHYYWGESHRTLYDRISEHFQDLKEMKEETPLVNHMLLHHPGDTPEFSIKAERSYKTSLGRQIGEAIKIGMSESRFLMNSKTEWGGNKIPRVVVEDEDPPPQPSPEPQPSHS